MDDEVPDETCQKDGEGPTTALFIRRPVVAEKSPSALKPFETVRF